MSKIKVGIWGFGKTGKSVVAEFLNDDAFQLEWVVRRSCESNQKFASHLLGSEDEFGKVYSIQQVDDAFFKKNPVDILVDFSNTTGVQHYHHIADCGTKIISAISKYEPEDLALLKSMAEKTTVLYSPNITLGINVLLVASQILQKIAPHADIEIVEEHFRGKSETSGTAKKIADALSLNHEDIRSIRAGGIVGRHEIIFGMPNQTIRLVHESISRSAFGQGAIFAAKLLQNRAAGLYTMDNMIADMFRSNLPVF